MHPTLYILTGPTAVGKTELALEWAQRNDAEIISCDSLLVYKGMNIGTAKPTTLELASVPHHLINVVDIRIQYTVKQYIEAALAAIQKIISEGRKILIVGGSGFYLKSFLVPLLDNVEIPAAIVNEVNKLYQEGGLSVIVQLLLERNPEGVGKLDLHNPRRVVKALQRSLVTGKTLMELEKDYNSLESPFAVYPKTVTLLERDQADLKNRIQKRVTHMLASGLIEEVQLLLKKGILENPSAASAIGYKEVIKWIQLGQIGPLASLEEEIIQNTLRLVSKQRKWFRHQMQFDQTINLSEVTPTAEILFSV